jgi:alpha-tubulin suppressor-like RCC1 family protein
VASKGLLRYRSSDLRFRIVDEATGPLVAESSASAEQFCVTMRISCVTFRLAALLVSSLAACRRPAPNPDSRLAVPRGLSRSHAATGGPSSKAGWIRQAAIWVRGNDGSTPGEVLQIQVTRLITYVTVGYGPPGEGPRGLAEDLPDTHLGWHSSRPDVASVDSVGRVTAVRPGRAYVVAIAHALTPAAEVAEGIVDSMPVVVRPVDSALATLRFTTVIASATGDAYHSCATTRDGRVLCWGSAIGVQHRLGFGSDSTPSFALLKASKGSQFRSVGTGFASECALIADGSAFCWGSNDWGQLGTGSPEPQTAPTPVAGGHHFLKLNVGRERACGVSTERQLYCWGSGLNDALGAPSRERCAYPIGWERKVDTAYASCAREPLLVMPTVPVRDVAVGDNHTCALSVEEFVYCWGDIYDFAFQESRPVRTQADFRLTSLTSGSRHLCGLDDQGRAHCWGRNWRGQLGQPAPRKGSRHFVPVARNLRFRTLSAGDDHTCGLTLEGQAYCWGDDSERQLGTGEVRLDSQIAVPAPVVGKLRFVSIAAGSRHTCAVSVGGGLYCWGTSLAVRPGLGVLKEEPEPFHVVGPP